MLPAVAVVSARYSSSQADCVSGDRMAVQGGPRWMRTNQNKGQNQCASQISSASAKGRPRTQMASSQPATASPVSMA